MSRVSGRYFALTAVFCLLTGTASQAISVSEYRNLVAECRRVTERPHPSPARLTDLRSRLAAVNSVTYPGGNTVAVDTDVLQKALLGDKPNSRQRFGALEGVLTASGTVSANGDPRAQAAKILLDKEFEDLRNPVNPGKDVIPSWWVRFSKWMKESAERFAEWLDKLLRNQRSPVTPNLSSVTAFVKFLQFLLYFLLAAGALVAIYLLARTASVRGWLKKRRKKGGADASLDVDLSGDGIVDPLGTARALAAKGEYRDAVRLAYIASLRRLQDNGLLVLEVNKTNWEYQRDLRRRSHPASDTLLPATQLFDRVWYGRRPGTAEEFDEAVHVHDTLGTAVRDTDLEDVAEPSDNLTEAGANP